MNHCYKCGEPTSNVDPECDRCRHSHSLPEDLQQIMENARQDFRARAVQLDWAKIKTLEDLVLVMSIFSAQLVVLRGTPEYDKLKHLLKDNQ